MEKILIIFFLVEYLFMILISLQFLFNIFGKIWYRFNKKRIRYNILNLIYQYLYVDIRPSIFDVSNRGGFSIDLFQWGGRKNISNPDKIKPLSDNYPYNEIRIRYYLLTQWDAYNVRRKLRLLLNIDKSDNDYKNIKYFGAFISYEKNISTYFLNKIEKAYHEKYKHNIIYDKLNEILNQLETDGYIFRINGVLYESDYIENLQYKKIKYSINEGYFGLTKKGMNFNENNNDISLMNNKIVFQTINDIIPLIKSFQSITSCQ